MHPIINSFMVLNNEITMIKLQISLILPASKLCIMINIQANIVICTG